ncbi:hypothetical protein [Streptomyces scabichelini]|nr:hypothetical protein [Streptomyces scabichelini]
MNLAWQQQPLTADDSMNLDSAYPRDRSNAARAACIEVMRHHL